ncbi:hypothetical protein NKR19_g3944 [Coniochaeta hoffmannii]|uniref:F-box domain-containing protein n=1 Tax=Coniochaeta hoffmannii TaxID=91930 RepID=A0AA38RTJ6_9PEZI|nr:hypothetical protein NKR19_g3944 [Coniochaeta hoffmannii]
MDTILSQQFLGLGQDSHLRKQNLLNLIPCLTHQEVRDLMAGLSKVEMQTDILSRLPPELRLNIAGQLGNFDVFPLLNVSRHWRAMWLQPDMLRIAADHCRYIDLSLLTDETSGGIIPEEWIALQYEILRRRRRRFLGRFSSATVVRHDIGDGHECKTKRVFRSPSIVQYGRDLELKALGDKLVVAGTSRVMFVWHLESNQGSQVLLPQQPSCCVTRGEYVAFLRRDSALLWKFGCELTALDLDPVLDSNQRISNAWADVASSYTMGIFFHPSEKGTLYISVCFTYVRQVAIHKFTSAGYSGVHEINLREIELETEENQRYPLKAQSHEWDASTQTLKSLYANSDFILDLPSFLECPGYSSWNLDPHHIFQDDDFIILFHRHGYTAWDFRAEPART